MLFEYEIDGSRLSVTVATSVKKDGSFRYRVAYGVGGDPEGARGSASHYNKLHELAAQLSELQGDEWELKELVFLMDPREYYGRVTNGTIDLIYQYITTNAPGSGQQYIFCPQLSKKRITMTHLDAKFAALMLNHQLHMDYNDIKWQDREIMLDLISQGVSVDMLETTMQLMR